MAVLPFVEVRTLKSPFALQVPVPADSDCSIREVLELVGNKWSVLIVILLGERTYRFNELYRAIEGVSQRVLAHNLRLLVRDGLVIRTPFAVVPPRVEYELTPLGRTLLVPLDQLGSWAEAHAAEIGAARLAHSASEIEQPTRS